jgi:hypothetical protein
VIVLCHLFFRALVEPRSTPQELESPRRAFGDVPYLRCLGICRDLCLLSGSDGVEIVIRASFGFVDIDAEARMEALQRVELDGFQMVTSELGVEQDHLRRAMRQAESTRRRK